MKNVMIIAFVLLLFNGTIYAQNKLVQTEITEKGFTVNQKYKESKKTIFTSGDLLINISPIDPNSLNETLTDAFSLNGTYNYSSYKQTREDYFLKKNGKLLSFSNKSNSELLYVGLDWLRDNDIIDEIGYSRLSEKIQLDFGIKNVSTNLYNPFNNEGKYLSVFKSSFTNNTAVPITFNTTDKIELLSKGVILKPLAMDEISSMLTVSNSFTLGKMSNLFRFYLNSELIIPANTTTYKYFATLPIDNDSSVFEVIYNDKVPQRSKWEISKETKEINNAYTFYELLVYPAGNYFYENIYVVLLNSNADAYIVGSKLYINKNDIDKELSILTYAIYEKKLFYFPLKFIPRQYLDFDRKKRKSLPNELIQIKI
jgi:hypothetical protein